MLVLKTAAHETVWGGEKLLPYAKVSKKIGHLYSLCCEEGLETVILNGPYKGRVFESWFQEHKGRFGLEKYDKFPLIIALVEAHENLSVQVHPDDQVAEEEEGAPYGKNESWFFLEAPAQGVILNGCTAKDGREAMERLQAGEAMTIVDTLSVKAGDYVYVEGGTLHALTAGSYLYEIEENSPWTYRFYDYDRLDTQGRKRELHIEKGIKALKPHLKSKAVRLGNEWVEERRYMLKKLEDVKEYKNESATLECITIIEGSCEIEQVRAATGTTIVLEPGEWVKGNLTMAMAARPK